MLSVALVARGAHKKIVSQLLNAGESSSGTSDAIEKINRKMKKMQIIMISTVLVCLFGVGPIIVRIFVTDTLIWYWPPTTAQDPLHILGSPLKQETAAGRLEEVGRKEWPVSVARDPEEFL